MFFICPLFAYPMRILLVSSTLDPAGSAIMNHARRLVSSDIHEVSFGSVDGSLLTWNPPSGYDLIIFLSKHQSASGEPAMCVHAIGNFGEASFGGEDHRLVPTHPALLSALYRSLRDAHPRTDHTRFEVSLEAVHHGPYTPTPSIFYELGSTPEHWADDAAMIMAQVLAQVLASETASRPSFFGIGSNHYCAGFSKLLLDYDFAGSCAKYALEHLSEEQIAWIADRVDLFVLDVDSMGSEKKRVIDMIEKLGKEYRTV